MHRASVIFLVLSCIGVCGVTGTSRGELILPQASSAAEALVHEVVDAFKGWGVTVKPDAAVYSEAQASSTSEHFHVLIKHVVPPADQRTFVEKWLDLRSHIKKGHGNVMFTLSKTLTDNLILYSYQVWESKEAFLDHATSEAVKPLAKYIRDKDIAIFLISLLPVSLEPDHHHGHHHHHDHHHHHSDHHHHHSDDHHDDKHHHHHHHHHSEGGDDSAALAIASYLQEPRAEGLTSQTLAQALPANGEPREPSNVIILTKSVVRPSVAKSFIKAFLKESEETRQEKGNLVYSLAKTLTDNLVFYGYSEWKDVDALQKHVSSDYAKKFAELVKEENIPTFITFLFPIESLDAFKQ